MSSSTLRGFKDEINFSKINISGLRKLDSGGQMAYVSYGEQSNRFIIQTPLMSVPYAFGTGYNNERSDYLTLSFGDYENTFTCIDFKEEHTDNGEKLTTRLIKADFYNDDYGIEPVYLISQISNGEYNMEEHNSEDTWEEIEAIYWFDQFDSDNPAFDNKHIRTIVENCDIFLDEM